MSVATSSCWRSRGTISASTGTIFFSRSNSRPAASYSRFDQRPRKRPVTARSQSICSSAMSALMKALASRWVSRRMPSTMLLPNFAAISSMSSWWPPPIIPPLHELARMPGAEASSARTDRPDMASVLAAERPVRPAPTTTTSTSPGRATSGGLVGVPASPHQNGVVLGMVG